MYELNDSKPILILLFIYVVSYVAYGWKGMFWMTLLFIGWAMTTIKGTGRKNKKK